LQEQREMKDEHKLVDHKNENQVTADLIFDGGDPPKGPGEPSTLASRASATSAQSALDERRGSAQSSGFAQELRGQALRKRSEENGVVVGVGRVFLEPQTKVHTRVCACVCMYVYKYLYVIYIYIYIYIYKIDVPTDSGILAPELTAMDKGGQLNGVPSGVPSSEPVSTLQPPPLVYRHTGGRDTGAQQGVILAPPIPRDTGAQQGEFTSPAGSRGTYTYNSNGRHKF
jgi:hypothetical protein